MINSEVVGPLIFKNKRSFNQKINVQISIGLERINDSSRNSSMKCSDYTFDPLHTY